MDLRKVASSFALTAMILASLVGVCKQMLVSCGLNCTLQSMGAMRMDMKMDGCLQDSSACVTSMKDHMATFASMYPSVTTNAVSLLLLVGVAFFLTRLLLSKNELGGSEKLRVKLRCLRHRLSNAVAPDFIVSAFSQGILNSRIYA